MLREAGYSDEQIAENVKALVDAVVKAKPAAVKGTYMKRATMSSTMGPGVRVDPQSLTA